ncbi:MAG: MgtC/SapB family protein [Methylocystaceae bacterium]
MSIAEIILRLALACLLGALIGLERESLNRPAGLRTYTLVCVGSALAMIVSLDMYYQYHNTVNADPGRIAAQVVSGIGFLGAGTIMREGATVRGLTTAAGLWVVACVGLAAGAGLYLPAIITTALVLFVLIYFFRFEQRITGMREYKAFIMTIDDRPGQIGRIGSVLGDLGVSIKNINLHHLDDDDGLEVEVMLYLPTHIHPSDVIDHLSNIAGMRSVDRLN